MTDRQDPKESRALLGLKEARVKRELLERQGRRVAEANKDLVARLGLRVKKEVKANPVPPAIPAPPVRLEKRAPPALSGAQGQLDPAVQTAQWARMVNQVLMVLRDRQDQLDMMVLRAQRDLLGLQDRLDQLEHRVGMVEVLIWAGLCSFLVLVVWLVPRL